MNFFVQTFSLKRPEGRHNFFIYFVSKLLEMSLELSMAELFFKKLRTAMSVTVPATNPIMEIFLRASRRQRQLISFVLFKINGEILRDDCRRILFKNVASDSSAIFLEMNSTLDVSLRTF